MKFFLSSCSHDCLLLLFLEFESPNFPQSDTYTNLHCSFFIPKRKLDLGTLSLSRFLC